MKYLQPPVRRPMTTVAEVSWTQIRSRLEEIHTALVGIERLFRDCRPSPQFREITSRAETAGDAAFRMAVRKKNAQDLVERQRQAREAQRTGIPQPLRPLKVMPEFESLARLEPDLLIEAKRRR